MLEAADILNATILIVDDQEAKVILLEEMLRNDGYKNITTTRSPRDVRGLHEQHRFDLILLDLHMPGMDGVEVIEHIKAIDKVGYLPVLVITAQPAHRRHAWQAGARHFVSKPFDSVDVRTRIHGMLEIRLLYRRLDEHNRLLEQTVLERTAELRQSEARFQRFTELASDWYWEQDAAGTLTQFSGPVVEMLGVGGSASTEELAAAGWNLQERATLDSKIANRQPFLDFIYTRTLADARVQYFQVSGEPMFDAASAFAGYRGIGLDVGERMRRA